MRISIICWFIIPVMTSFAFSQDMGTPDTVRIINSIGDIQGEYSALFSVPVSVYNDNDLNSIVIPLEIDGYSGWAIFRGVSFSGGRLDNPDILDIRDVYSFGSDSITMDSIVIRLEAGSGSPLPAGSGIICELNFKPVYGGNLLIDSLPVSPYGNLQLTPVSNNSFTPEFKYGMIEIECDYEIGDLRNDGGVQVSDILGFNKGYMGCFDWDLGDPWHADVNCDRRTDQRDAIAIYDYIFLGGSLCECGTYTPAYYNDPGIPDTVWIENMTMTVGIPDTIDVGIINDELLRGFSLALEWDGTATLGYGYGYDGFYIEAPRVTDLGLIVEHYQCEGNDQVNPDTMYAATWNGPGGNIPPGTEAVIRIPVMPLSEGTISWRLVNYITWYDFMLTRGAESMFVTEDHAAIIPVISGGNITILPRPCGDANGDGAANVSDAVYIINYVFAEGDPPQPLEIGDVNCDGDVNVSDAVWIINYVFVGGDDPCDSDGDGEPDC